MPLIDQWKSDPTQFKDKSIQQLLAWCGDGVLKDGNKTSSEFRDFLAHIPSEQLAQYGQQCLELKFPDGGIALQDIVNQIGKRLGFQIEYGRYRGVPSQIGFDGLWKAHDDTTILIEVKTSDAYRLSLDTAATYRRKLIQEKRLSEPKSSILYVVGRYDTGELEAQVRGSRHAWDIRLVSVDSLLNLLRIKEELEDQQTIDKIREVLTPREYTRVDGIVDLVFSATSESKIDEIEEDEDDEKTEKKFTPVGFRPQCIERISKHFNDSLIKKTSSIYATPDDLKAVSVSVSREYERATGTGYWFAYHPSQIKTLEAYNEAWVSFGCGSGRQILLLPFSQFKKWLEQFNQTIKEDRAYWHVHIHQEKGLWILSTKTGFSPINITQYLLP